MTIRVANAGKLVTKGFDAQLSAQLAKGLAHRRPRLYRCPLHQLQKRPMLSRPDQLRRRGLDSSGNRLPNAPEWKGVGDIRYEWAFTDGLNGNVQLGFSSQSSIEYFSNADPNGRQKGFTTFDIQVGLAGRESWQLSLFCRNCGDQRYVGAVGNYPLITTDYLQNYSYGAFRNIGASLDSNSRRIAGGDRSGFPPLSHASTGACLCHEAWRSVPEHRTPQTSASRSMTRADPVVRRRECEQVVL
ncbi:TonB-dependent receptor [Sphingomonas sp. MG17]|uniref:TonB-dependent receptor n=1 Tax=Sphingomonas tagetis TaxID=2949092 RepID=A0A9X2HM41_9SPHN|nr:TonB-dependent receptor [Sphingomonas tagetis]MCP3730986.1 TonB-dependent receptor [Sphingomonas tagetis]